MNGKNGTEEPKKLRPFNGHTIMVMRIIEALVIAFIVAGISLWGNSRAMEAEFKNLCLSLDKMERSIAIIGAKVDNNALMNERQSEQILSLAEKMREHTKGK